MIKVDILSPVGGLHGGIENVIRCWVSKLPDKGFDIRVIHMTPGRAYLQGFPKIYSFPGPEKPGDKEYYAEKYLEFIKGSYAPDICVAINWPLMTYVASEVRAKANGNFKIVSFVHNKISEYNKAGFGGLSHMLLADGHISINNQIKNEILSTDKAARVYVVGNPVDLPEDTRGNRINDNSVGLPKDNTLGNINEEYALFDKKTLCYVGRIEDIKRLDIILEALYRAKDDWKLKIVGTGAFTDEMMEIIDYLKLNDRVTVYGWQEKPWEKVTDACISVMASDYEGFGMTNVEALIRGKTVISTPVDGVVDYIVPGVNGFLFDYEDAIGLAKILDYLSYGELSMPKMSDCRASVERFITGNYIENVSKALKDIYNN